MVATTQKERSIEVLRLNGIAGEVKPTKLYQNRLAYESQGQRYVVRLSPLERVYIERGKK